jgi:hypothetical protein
MNSIGMIQIDPTLAIAPIENPQVIAMNAVQEFFVRLKDKLFIKCIFLLEKTDLYKRFYKNILVKPLDLKTVATKNIRAALLLAELIIKMENSVRLIMFPRVGNNLCSKINNYAQRYSAEPRVWSVLSDTIRRLNTN